MAALYDDSSSSNYNYNDTNSNGDNNDFTNNDGLNLKPAPDIPIRGMVIAGIPILFVAFVSLKLRLHNVTRLLVAAARCVTQLLLLGLLLYPIFKNNQPYVVLPYVGMMSLFACREASVKPKYNYQGMRGHMLLAILISLLVSLSLICFGVLQPDPWADAQVVIPVAGMMLGSCVNALSLGMDRFLLSLWGGGGGSATLQTYIACGATRWEASLSSLRQGIETGLTPNLNQMSVMGLVSIPGIFTGQVLGGTSPFLAAKYQIVLMFFVCSNSTIILFLVMLQAIFWELFDGKEHTFRAAMVQQRTGGKPKDIVHAAVENLVNLFNWLINKATMAAAASDSDNQHKGIHHNSNDVERCNYCMTADNKEERPGTFRKVKLAPAFENVCEKSSEVILQMVQGRISYGGDEGGRPLLEELHLEIYRGEMAVISGPSGCGKSTLLRALARLEPLEKRKEEKAEENLNTSNISRSRGTASTNKHSPMLTLRGNANLAATTWRSDVLYVHQSGGQGITETPMELLSNLLALQAQQSRRRYKGDTEANVKARFVEHMEALDLPRDMLDRRLDIMSGGEAQRMYLCLCLALRPTVLLLDEPTSACDERAARKVEDLIVTSTATVVWITHDPAQMERLGQLEQTSVINFHKATSSGC